MTERRQGGFLSMSPERLREVASKGGKTGGRHIFTSEEAREAGRKGGTISRKRAKDITSHYDEKGAQE